MKLMVSFYPTSPHFVRSDHMSWRFQDQIVVKRRFLLKGKSCIRFRRTSFTGYINWHVRLITTKHENRPVATVLNNAFSAHRPLLTVFVKRICYYSSSPGSGFTNRTAPKRKTSNAPATNPPTWAQKATPPWAALGPRTEKAPLKNCSRNHTPRKT